MTRFPKTAWLTVVVTVFVILWGAVVRATGSGAGCGNNWPTCNGEVVPLSGSAETAIEFIHRITSAGLGLLIVALLVMARRRFPAGHRVRRAALATFALVIVESLVGAGLVLFEQTGDFEGVSRAYWQAGHFVNTMLLLGAATLTAWWATAGPAGHDRVATPTERRWIGAVAGAMLLLGVSGAIAALGDTLFPVDSFAEGLERELSSTGHVFERLRIYHPAIAIGGGLLAVWVANRLAETRPGRVERIARGVAVLVLVQLGVGTVNALLAAPVWIQIVHLLLADMLWMAIVVLSADVLLPARSKVPA
jgi:heme A synthase